MSISSEIARISGNVSDALDAIENKGVTIPSGSNSDDLATLISQISSGGGSIVISDTTDSHGGTIRTITGTTVRMQSKSNISPTTSSQTIEPDEGYTGLSSVQINAVASGTAGTPTATKGTVSNHSVSVTPSVTNTTGYITGSTKTGTAVTVSASELVSGNKEITANGTDIDVATYSTVSVVVPSGTSKNTQVMQSTSRTTATSLTKVLGDMIVSKDGTYDVYWSGARTNTSSGYTWGTRLYIDGTAYGTENTTWSNNVQSNHLSGVSLTANQKLSVYARGRGGSYYACVPMLTIIEA